MKISKRPAIALGLVVGFVGFTTMSAHAGTPAPSGCRSGNLCVFNGTGYTQAPVWGGAQLSQSNQSWSGWSISNNDES